MMKRITPSFPTQSSIDEALKNLNLSDRLRYDELMEEYKLETSKEDVNHTLIAELIAEAQKILKSGINSK